jgi:hypothetical protein
MVNHDPEHDVDRDRDHDNDNDVRERREKTLGAVAPAPAGGALTSLAALSTALNSVDMTSVGGRSGKPMLQFKSRENNGTWMFGQKRTVVEDDSRWAVNVLSFKWGYVYFDNNNKPHERMVPILSQPMPDVTTLPDTGFEWQKQWTVNMKCTSGADAGTEVVYKANTDGGIQAIAGAVEAVRNRLNDGGHDGKVAPIVRLEKDSYQHGQYGRVWTPQLNIVDWMSLDGPAPAPADGGGREPPREPPTSPPPAELPRRRRVA